MLPKKSTKARAPPARQANGKAAKGAETPQVAQQETTVPDEPNPVADDARDQVESVDETPPKDDGKSPSKKRKTSAAPDQPQKAPRRSARGTPKSQPSPRQLLRYLLSKDAEDLCRPDDEREDMKSRTHLRTYSTSVLSPFEELLCAVILSRPISHRLGLRSIRTVLNDPYNFTNPKAIQAAGGETRHQALWDAKTQHKAKTADQIGQIAEVVLKRFTSAGDKDGTRLQKALDDGHHDIDRTLHILKENIQGLGSTGLDIFRRRVQWLWHVGYPFVDDRTSHSLHQLGLPQDGEGVERLIDEHWGQLDAERMAGDDEETKKRRAFVVVLERATGAQLEGKLDALVEAATKAS